MFCPINILFHSYLVHSRAAGNIVEPVNVMEEIVLEMGTTALSSNCIFFHLSVLGPWPVAVVLPWDAQILLQKPRRTRSQQGFSELSPRPPDLYRLGTKPLSPKTREGAPVKVSSERGL